MAFDTMFVLAMDRHFASRKGGPSGCCFLALLGLQVHGLS